MLTYDLVGSAQIKNGSQLEPLDHEEYPFDYKFTARCTGPTCRTSRDRPFEVNRFTEYEWTQFKKANLIIKCKECKRERIVNITRYDGSINDGEETPIVKVVTHGLELLTFIPDDQFQCKVNRNGRSETVEEIDLSEGEWTNGDVEISNVKWELVLKRN